jgi:exopolyphosphatase/guanosine-5'-triphosphate,3'-diphosphate pyrophosphatase
MSLLAVLDIGSNTFRLLIGNVNKDRIDDVLYERRITRLGDRVNQIGKLQDKNIEASLAVLKEFSSIISSHGIKYIKAVATSALREASNSDIFIQKVSVETGISIEVISGKKEAELTLKGILLSLPESSPITHHPLFIIDIGGGSTEWIICKNKQPVDMGSIPVGVIKLAGDFIKTDPVSETDITELNKEILSNLVGLKMRIGNYIDKQICFIGTAGTFTTIASIDLGLETYSREKIHLHRLPLSRLQDIGKKLSALPLIERKKVKGLEPERADLIIPGIQFTINTMEFFQFDELTISDYGLLEGVLLETLNEKNEKNISETKQP